MPFAMLINKDTTENIKSFFISLKKRRLKVLEDTINSFKRNTRNMTNGICVYMPSKVNEGCAIGRLIKDKDLCARLDVLGTASGVQNNRIYEQMPKHVQSLGQDFLRDLQMLHDGEHNWDETGLSIFGKESVERFKIKFKL